MSSFLPQVRDRLAQLTETLHQLKDRVREAVATEMGRVVSETVRDLLTNALRVRAEEVPRSRPDPRYRSSFEEDDPDPWGDDSYHSRSAQCRVEPKPSSTWGAALSVGTLVAKWLWMRRFPLIPCLTAGIVALVATLNGGPVLQASLAAVATAADLVTMTQPGSS